MLPGGRQAEGAPPRLGMNPDIDTEFLPDRDREKREAMIKKQLEQEYDLRQEVCRPPPASGPSRVAQAAAVSRSRESQLTSTSGTASAVFPGFSDSDNCQQRSLSAGNRTALEKG